MSIFNKIRDAFHPVEQALQSAGHELEPGHIAQVLTDAIENPIRQRIPNHLSLGEAAEIISIAQPDAVDLDLFVGFGVELGVELEMEFDIGITIEDPARCVGNIVDLIENPPETVHQLCDKLWGIVPSEVRVYERLQAVVGEQVQVRWTGENVMERVVQYIGKRGWLEKRLRP